MFEALMPTWASTAAAWLLTYALHSTLLLGLAWLVSRRLAGRAPLAEEAIWRGALLGAVLTASLQLAGGWEPLAGSWRLESTSPPAAAATRLETAPLPAAAREVAARPLAPRTDEPVAASPAAPSQFPAGAAVLGLWLMGAFLIGAWHARSYLRLH
ncbi:MAG TPA: hypothetical protein VEL74_07625, partial [Thermoanaerobaculia bacterium]|nr:hypothetical protein [Thermoanaerobaculia bacterium]